MTSTLPKVAIVGGGPSGLCLALALCEKGITSELFESRDQIVAPSGGLVLSPNALRLLERLGVYSRLLPKGYEFENSDIVNEAGETLDRHYYGHKRLYGYKALRIARYTLNEELLSMVEARSIPIRYGCRLTRVVSDANAVVFEINGEPKSADILIGADGIHSSVRTFLSTEQPTYTGIIALLSIIPRAEVRWSRPDHPPAAAIRGKPGAMLLVPEDPQDRTTMAGIQLQLPELDRTGWEALQADKQRLKALLNKDYADWGDVNKSIIESMCRHVDTILVWPFYHIPSLSTWTSQTRRVILIGDAAHAVPPSSGQGVSQAIEDVYSLATLLRSVLEQHIALERAVDFWFGWRNNRVKEIDHVAKVMNIKRMSDEDRKKYADVPEEDLDKVQSGEGQYAWLFNTKT